MGPEKKQVKMKQTLFIFLTGLLIVSCSQCVTEAVCVAPPPGEIVSGKVNVTATRGLTSALNPAGDLVADDTVYYEITDIQFVLDQETKNSPSGLHSSPFSQLVSFDPGQGGIGISFTIGEKQVFVAAQDLITTWQEPAVEAGIYIFYIIIQDFQNDEFSVLVVESDGFECNDLITDC